MEFADDWQADPEAVVKEYPLADYLGDIIRTHDFLRRINGMVLEGLRTKPNDYLPAADFALMRSWRSHHANAKIVDELILPIEEADSGPVENAAEFRQRLAWMNENEALDYHPEAEAMRKQSTESIVEMLGLTG